MAQFEPYKDQIAASGATLVYIAAEKREGVFHPAQYLARNPISFPFLLDEDRQVTKAYGVYRRIGLDAFNIARTATFVVDREGVVRWMYIGQNQRDRSPVEELLSAAREAKRGG